METPGISQVCHEKIPGVYHRRESSFDGGISATLILLPQSLQIYRHLDRGALFGRMEVNTIHH